MRVSRVPGSVGLGVIGMGRHGSRYVKHLLEGGRHGRHFFHGRGRLYKRLAVPGSQHIVEIGGMKTAGQGVRKVASLVRGAMVGVGHRISRGCRDLMSEHHGSRASELSQPTVPRWGIYGTVLQYHIPCPPLGNHRNISGL